MSDALFRANPPLSELDLSQNTIADIGAKAVAEYIPRAFRLSILKMQWNKIRADGGAAICEAVRDSHSMRNVDLSWNGIGAKRNGLIGEKLAEAANMTAMTSALGSTPRSCPNAMAIGVIMMATALLVTISVMMTDNM